ncbi:hypothetical protein BC832DRAFT_557065 [Gaertneriomyces semiglobifer]|nr:hypothetical protein BC832DRAFT_557065 [Gaertneriomyces semiglobifer]
MTTAVEGLARDEARTETVTVGPKKLKERHLHKLGGRRKGQLALYQRAENAPLEELIADVDAGEAPTPFILILNAGNTGDVGRVTVEDLEREFGAHAGFKAIEMILGRPYSYAVYESPSAAYDAYKALQYSQISTITGYKPLLLSFAKRVSPDVALADPKEILECVPGLHAVLDFVTPEEECEVLMHIHDETRADKWIPLNKRRVQHFGYRFDYPLNTVIMDTDIIDPIPPWCASLLERYQTHFPEFQYPDQLTINEYWPGAGIAPHGDRHSVFTDCIVAISLGSGVIMEFRRPADHQSHDSSPTEFVAYNVYLPPRSLIVMSGESRYRWEHSIRPRRTDIIHGRAVERGTRVSLTFRNIKRVTECECGWEYTCDMTKDETGR